MTNEDYLNDNWNTEKSHVTQTPVKIHQLTLVGKTLNGLKNNDNDSWIILK